MSNEWLSELKVGDKVFIDGRFTRRVAVVERLTKTQCVIEGTRTRYRRDDGREIGRVGRWSARERLERCSPSDEAEYMAKLAQDNEVLAISKKLDRVYWRKLPLATLRAIDKLIKEAGE